MPLASLAALQWYGPACAALVGDPGIGTLEAATPSQTVRAGIDATGLGEVGVLRPFRCRNAALDAGGVGTAEITPKRFIRSAMTVAVNELTASDVEGALLNMRIENGVTFVQAMRALMALAANNATGLDGPTAVFKSRDGSKDRMQATLSGGNRTVTAIDLE